VVSIVFSTIVGLRRYLAWFETRSRHPSGALWRSYVRPIRAVLGPGLYASQFELDALCETRPATTSPDPAVLAIRETDAGERELVALRWVWSRPGPKGRTTVTA